MAARRIRSAAWLGSGAVERRGRSGAVLCSTQQSCVAWRLGFGAARGVDGVSGRVHRVVKRWGAGDFSVRAPDGKAGEITGPGISGFVARALKEEGDPDSVGPCCR